MIPATLNDIFLGARDRYAGRPAVMRIRDDARWHDIPFATIDERVRNLRAGLQQLGFVAGDRIAILSENRPEWAIADFACLAARIIDVPIYPTLTAHQMQYMLRDSGARGIFVASARHLAKILEIRGALPDLEHVMLFDGLADAPGVTAITDVEAAGAAGAGGDWTTEARSVGPADLATIIYTSGTTGEPKGVMLSHGNIASNVAGALAILPVGASDAYLSFLPLCHIFERMVGHYTMLQAGATISYSRGFDRVAGELPEVRPTIVASVPRLYEKIHAAAADTAARRGGATRALFEWAVATGDKRLDYVLDRRRVPPGLAAGAGIADVLVFRKLRARFGGQVRFMVSGGAPLNPAVCRFFTAARLQILEGYGLTETSPVIAFNRIGAFKPGTVGQVLPGVEVSIAADGEILTRGPHVMQGYYHKPEATAEAIDREGWFHTGDIGELDAEGYLRITDRKKDLIKTSGGKYVAPQPIENMVRLNRFFANAVLLGDRHQYPIMLLVPNFAALDGWLAAQGEPRGTPDDIIARAPVRELLEREARRSLRDLAQFEMPKKFLILPRDFSVEADELTPTLKVKRRVVEMHYRQQIDQLYGS